MRTKPTRLDEMDRHTVTAATLRLVLLCLEQTSYKGMQFEAIKAFERADGRPPGVDWIKTGLTLACGGNQVVAAVVFKSEPDNKIATTVEAEVNRYYQIRHALYSSPTLRPVTWDGAPISARLVDLYDNLKLPEFTLR